MTVCTRKQPVTTGSTKQAGGVHRYRTAVPRGVGVGVGGGPGGML